MKILEITWTDDEQRVGILTLSTGKQTFPVFCFPCSFQAGDVIDIPLSSMIAGDVIRVDSNEYGIEPIKGTLESRITARVEDARKGIVSVGEIEIELDGDLPGDVLEGEAVFFTSLRLDARKT